MSDGYEEEGRPREGQPSDAERVRGILCRIARNLLENHRGKTLGALAGLFFALLMYWVGFLWALFILICAGVGFFIGKRVDEDREDLLDILDRLLPPGMRYP